MKKTYRKVLLIRPPTTLKRGVKHFGVGEPLGLLYVAASLEKAGYKVSVLDALCDPGRREDLPGYITYGMGRAAINRALRKFSPDLVGVTWFTNSNAKDVAETCALVKRAFPRIPVVAGGTYPTLFPARVLQDKNIDYVIMGEGELRLPKLLAALGAGSEPDFDGAAWRSAKGVEVRRAVSRVEDLDSLPPPSRDLVDMKKYFSLNAKLGAPDPVKILISATRGCFGDCSYCSVWKTEGRGIRARSVESIAAEIQGARKTYGAETFYFIDNNILFNRAFFRSLLGKLAALKITWQVPLGFYPDLIDTDLLRRMAKSGLTALTLAVESGSPRILRDVMRKKVALQRVPGLVRDAQAAGLPANAFFIVGVPGETEKTLLETLKFSMSAGFDAVTFHYFVPISGTDLHARCLREGLLEPGYTLLDEVMTGEPCLAAPPAGAEGVSPARLKQLMKRYGGAS